MCLCKLRKMKHPGLNQDFSIPLNFKSKDLLVMSESNLSCIGYYSITFPRVLFDLGIEKNYSVKLCLSNLAPPPLQITYCDFYWSLGTKNVICLFNQLNKLSFDNFSEQLLKETRNSYFYVTPKNQALHEFAPLFLK